MNSCATLLTAFLLIAACAPESKLSEELFAGYYEPYEITLSEPALSSEPLLQEAHAAYQQGDYALAHRELAYFTDEVRRLPLPMLAQAICAIELDSLGEAELLLEILMNHPEVGPDAVWYRALTSVKRDRLAEAASLLEERLLYGSEIYVPSTVRERQARALIDAIRRG